MPDPHATPGCEYTLSAKAPAQKQAEGEQREGGKAKMKKRRSTTEPEPAILCLTQNVRGLLKENATIDAWLDGLRLRTELGFVDVALLQETRATTRWKGVLHRKYAAGWGLRADAHLDQWSFWGPTPTAAAGVAILVRPGNRVRNPRPVWKEHWSQWFMAVQVDVGDSTYTIVNVYGPSDRQERERVFRTLVSTIQPTGTTLIGGDFNCTLDDSLDRSKSTRHSHDSVALHELLRAWKLEDALADEQDAIGSENERREFHATRHTYRYRLDDGELASSRLDRFYIDRVHAPHVRQVEVTTPVSDSDHDGLLLVMADARQPPERRRKARPRLKYPLPHGTREAVEDVSSQLLTQAEASSKEAPAVTAHKWHLWKQELRKCCLQVINRVTRAKTRAYRQRRRRLIRAMRAVLPATGTSTDDRDTTVAAITRRMEGLTIDDYKRVHAIRAELMRLTRTRRCRRRRERYAVYAHGTPGAERAFFRRFNVRQGQRQAATLPPDPDKPANPAERLAEDWKPITQRGDREPDKIRRFLDSIPTPTALPDLRGLDDPFTEEEMAQAIAACPRNKTPGPDGIPNDWHPAHMLSQGTRCVHPKMTRPRTGLDYRPIALLDNDYKIYSRLLLNRLRPSLPDLVSETQYGFVPGRQAHDALDVFHALQTLVRKGTAPSTALAISLDFAKAYDTLDRPYLLAVLQRVGCPRGFLRAVEHMHLATTAAYMAEADISDDHRVLNGIRQGCPLAPTLFVLAVDTLYQAVAAHPDIPGIPLPSGTEIGPAGYADDTNIYVRGSDAMEPLFHLLSDFEEASGLGVNRNKCVAIALHATERPSVDLGWAFPSPNPPT